MVALVNWAGKKLPGSHWGEDCGKEQNKLGEPVVNLNNMKDF